MVPVELLADAGADLTQVRCPREGFELTGLGGQLAEQTEALTVLCAAWIRFVPQVHPLHGGSDLHLLLDGAHLGQGVIGQALRELIVVGAVAAARDAGQGRGMGSAMTSHGQPLDNLRANDGDRGIIEESWGAGRRGGWRRHGGRQ